ncbi:hypothetical protein BRC86_08375 [Halobacteriales archaeon QS_3_64_16]|nr:MAG: hypothetical protein BRC86_08375 [Halobacteriales archaeon QS_3_64_16]
MGVDGSDTRASDRSAPPASTSAAMSDAGPLYNETLTDALPSVVFVLDDEGIVRLWNRAAEEFTGTAREDVLGTATVSAAFYQDDRRAKTLADKVVEAPEWADEVFGVERSTEVSYTRYEDSSTMLNAKGEEVHIDFTAAYLRGRRVRRRRRDGRGLLGTTHDERARERGERDAFGTGLGSVIGPGELRGPQEHARRGSSKHRHSRQRSRIEPGGNLLTSRTGNGGIGRPDRRDHRASERDRIAHRRSVRGPRSGGRQDGAVQRDDGGGRRHRPAGHYRRRTGSKRGHGGPALRQARERNGRVDR